MNTGNPHFDQSIEALDVAAKLVPGSAEVAYLAIQTQATLALAFEQRTANLIAYEQAQWSAMQDNCLDPTGVELWKEAAGQISVRLGLKKGK